MKLIQRMFVKQLLAIVIPCVVAAIVYIVLLSAFVKSNENIGLAESMEDSIARVQLYNQLSNQLTSVSMLHDELLFESIATNIRQVHSGLVVLQNGSIVHQSNNLDDINTELLLNSIKHNRNIIDLGRFNYDLYYVQASDFNSTTYIFAHKQISGLSKSNVALISAIIVFIIIYLGCCIFINIRLNRKLIEPIQKIKEAAVHISEGKLDSIVVVDTQDEVEELGTSLEILRMKLKESIMIQRKYDDNRSFLISSISHDLRTPVTTIKGYVEALRDGIAQSPEKKEQYLCIIDKKANQINEMIEDLLLYSKLDLNQIPFNFEKVNLVNYIQDGIDEYTPYFQANHVQLNVQFLLTSEARAIVVQLDIMRFMRVIQNIWNNAVIYNDKKDKEITISIRETYSSYVIEIRDNGKGLDNDKANHIFERFYRTDQARQSDQGSGLGLSIAKHIVEAHQGQIWARGVLGLGTSIFISLPKVKE